MARASIDTVRNLKFTVDRAESRIEELEAQAEKMTAILSGMPRGGNSKTDDAWATLIDYKGRLGELLCEYFKACKELEEGLDCINNPTIRTAMQYRYIDCKKIDDIAEAMGYDERWVRRLIAKGKRIYERESESDD